MLLTFLIHQVFRVPTLVISYLVAVDPFHYRSTLDSECSFITFK